MAEGNKMAQAQRALTFCLANLNPGDRFDVVRFSTEAEALFGKLEPADKGRREQARTFVEALTPIGGTAIEEALLMAMAPAKTQAETGRPYVVIFLTDGRPTIGETDEDRIVASVTKSLDQKASRIFSFGIGTDINTHLLDKLTERTRATSQYVLPDQDIELEVSRFYTKINEPVLADLRLTVSGPVRVSKMEPRALPDLFKGEQLEVLGRYTGSGDVAFVLEGSVNGQPRKLVYEGRLPESDTTHESIPRLWATRRVGFLLDEIRLRGESKELRDEVTDLARRYGIVTPYTAYLIVEDEARRNVPTARRSLQIMGGDGEGVEELERSFDSMKSEKSGSGGVRAAQANQALKKAPSADYAQKQANEYAASENKDSRSTRMVQSQESRYVNGRAFYRNGEQWVDANAQDDQAEKKRKNIKFGSEEWFNLLGAHPEAGPWLALGQNVQVVLGGTLYDIRE
jgi:Ca-activated chloride channel family protein